MSLHSKEHECWYTWYANHWQSQSKLSKVWHRTITFLWKLFRKRYILPPIFFILIFACQMLIQLEERAFYSPTELECH